MEKTPIGKKIVVHAILILGSIIMIFPFLWMILTALKTKPEAIVVPPTVLPAIPQWQNFVEIFEVLDFGKFFLIRLFRLLSLRLDKFSFVQWLRMHLLN